MYIQTVDLSSILGSGIAMWTTYAPVRSIRIVVSNDIYFFLFSPHKYMQNFMSILM